MWRLIPDFEDYEVSSRGRIRRATASRCYAKHFELTPKINQDGYRVVTLYRNRHPHELRIARLVALVFIGDPPSPAHEVAHGDGSKSNDHFRNLRWATSEENKADKRLHGSMKGAGRGSLHHFAVLSESAVERIRAMCAKGRWRPCDAALEYGVSRPTISDVLHERTWRHVR
jgi:hypothetical protein